MIVTDELSVTISREELEELNTFLSSCDIFLNGKDISIDKFNELVRAMKLICREYKNIAEIRRNPTFMGSISHLQTINSDMVQLRHLPTS